MLKTKKINAKKAVVYPVVGITSVIVYTHLCGRHGYKMVRPIWADDTSLQVQTITRKIVSAPLHKS